MIHVGLDLDNTLIDYAGVFGVVGVELGLLPAEMAVAPKLMVRQYLRGLPGGEEEFMRLQGQVYGRYIGRARLFDGVIDFIRQLSAAGARLSIVSHKTRYGHYDEARVDLRGAARNWLEANGLCGGGFGLPPDRIYFEDSQEQKLARIAALVCDVFVDDLIEVLDHPAFPRDTQPIWFAPTGAPVENAVLTPFRSWREITEVTLRYMAAVSSARQ